MSKSHPIQSSMQTIEAKRTSKGQDSIPSEQSKSTLIEIVVTHEAEMHYKAANKNGVHAGETPCLGGIGGGPPSVWRSGKAPAHASVLSTISAGIGGLRVSGDSVR